MANLFRPHYPHLQGYCFPVVTAILDKIGLPQPLWDIPEPYKGSLAATLATELTRLSANVMRQGLKTVFTLDADRECLNRHGGPDYLRMRREEEAVSTRVSKLQQDSRDLELAAHFVSDHVSSNEPGVKTDVSPFGGRVHWRYDLFPADEIDPVRRALKRYWRERRALELKRDQARLAQKAKTAEIRTSPSYVADLDRTRWTHVRADFGKQARLQSDGAAFYLRNCYYSWWRDFTTSFEDQVEVDSKGALQRLGLRDPQILKAIHEQASKNTNWDSEARTIFKENSMEWGTTCIGPGSFSKMRWELRNQDHDALEWFAAHPSPFDFYAEWLVDLKDSRSDCVYWDPSRLNRAWLDELLKQFPILHSRKERDSRFNELSWCLSLGWDNPYPFVPLMSVREPEKDWVSHCKEWWILIKAAQLKPAKLPATRYK